MTTIYRPAIIETVAQAEALRAGTLARPSGATRRNRQRHPMPFSLPASVTNR